MQLIKTGDDHYFNAALVRELYVMKISGTYRLTIEFENNDAELAEFNEAQDAMQALTRMVQELVDGKAVIQVTGE